MSHVRVNLQMYVSVNMWTDAAQPIAERDGNLLLTHHSIMWRSAASWSLLRMRECWTAAGRIWSWCTNAWGGGLLSVSDIHTCACSTQTAAAHRWRAYIWRFSMQVDEPVYLHTKGQRFIDTGWKGVLVVDARTHFRALPRYLWARYRTLKHSERALQWGGACQGVHLALPKCSWDWEKVVRFF